MKERCALLVARVVSVLLLSAPGTGAAQSLLAKVKSAKRLTCGVAGNLPGFSFTDEKGAWRGLDVDICKAIAAAAEAEPRYVPLNAKVRFTALQSGEVDVLVRNTTWNMGRDTKLGFDFTAVNFYDGQQIMVPRTLKVTSVKQLDGASICIQSGTTTEQNLNDYFKTNKLKFKAVVFETLEDANKAYLAGRCDAYTTDGSGLAANRSSFKNPEAHVILPEALSKEPLGPYVRQGDPQWADVVRWTIFALITAEEKGITQANVREQAANPDPEVQRLLGFSGSLGQDAGLAKDWAIRAIGAVGNYGEVFERNVGSQTPLKLERGRNQLWTQGGLLFSPPFN